jgi:hypothetical protein
MIKFREDTRIELVDGLAHIPELALRPGMNEAESSDLIARRLAYVESRDAPVIAKAKAKHDRKAAKLAKVFGGG